MDTQAQDSSDTAQGQLKPLVLLNGTANEGSTAPLLGLIDVGESEAAYVFRVALPGTRKDASQVKCAIQCDGKVEIHGIVVADGGVLENSSITFQTRVDQQNPLGPFTILFNLPGPVDPRLFAPTFRPDGILEATVVKQMQASLQQEGPPQGKLTSS